MIVRSDRPHGDVIEGTAPPPTDSGTGGPPSGPVQPENVTGSGPVLPELTGTTSPEKDRGNGN